MDRRPRRPNDVRPWWREGLVWMLIGGPAVVIVAGIATAVLAWNGADDEVLRPDVVRASVAAKDPLAPAQRARNHANTPADGQ